MSYIIKNRTEEGASTPSKEGEKTIFQTRALVNSYRYIRYIRVTVDIERNTPPADGNHPQQPPVTTRGDWRLNLMEPDYPALVFAATSSNILIVSDFGRSMGCPNARAQTALAVTPSNRLTPNNTV
jgi:hypothetical protein